jgi:hypothetical protein
MQIPIDPGTSSEELAYMLLEKARLSCGGLMTHAAEEGHDLSTDAFREIYANLGMAGYYASARLEPDHRSRLLERARSRAARDEPISAGALADATASATRGVERALTVTGLLDHLHLAHVHVMAACEALETTFAVRG